MMYICQKRYEHISLGFGIDFNLHPISPIMKSHLIGAHQPLRPHQRTVRNLLYNLTYELDLNRFDPLPDTRIDETDPVSERADIVVVDLNTEKVCVAIDVTTRRELGSARQRARMYFADYPFLQEAFLVDYETEDWYRFTMENLEDADEIDDARGNAQTEEVFDLAHWDPDLDYEDELSLPGYSQVLHLNMSAFAELNT